MKYVMPALALLAAGALPFTLHAQSKPVDVYVSVVDPRGEPATDLAAADVRVKEDGVAREVLKVAAAAEPMTVALLVDDSQAAGQGIQMIREGVETFIKALAGKAEIGLFTFGERPTVAVPYTTDQKRLLDGGSRIFPRQGSGAYLVEAISEVSKGLEKKKPARAVIVVLTLDAEVEFSDRQYDQVLPQLDRSGAALHVIALGSPSASVSDQTRNRNMLLSLGTERTGGRREQVLALTSAGPKMAQLANELLHQYVVTYARPDTLIPPSKMEVTVTRPGLKARARTRTGQAAGR